MCQPDFLFSRSVRYRCKTIGTACYVTYCLVCSKVEIFAQHVFYKLYYETKIVNVIKLGTLSWLGDFCKTYGKTHVGA